MEENVIEAFETTFDWVFVPFRSILYRNGLIRFQTSQLGEEMSAYIQCLENQAS